MNSVFRLLGLVSRGVSRFMSSSKFTCKVIGIGNTARTAERTAATASEAAEQCAKAMHTAYWSQAWRDGTDRDGAYSEFSIYEGKRPVATVRVYEVKS